MPVIEIRRFEDPAAFLDVAGSFLTAREPEHMLTLGIVGTLVAQGGPVRNGALMTATRGGQVVATATWNGGWEVVLSEVDDARAVPALAEAFAGAGVSGIHAPDEHVDASAAAWAVAAGGTYRPMLHERIYAIETVTPPTRVPGRLRRATSADREVLIEWMTAFDLEAFGPEAGRRDMSILVDELIDSPHRTGWVWDDDGPVSTGCTTGATPNGIRVGAVYTPPDRRGRGYASACVADISRRELDAGRRWCFLFTDLNNPTSNRIYQAIGYRPIRDVQTFRFKPS